MTEFNISQAALVTGTSRATIQRKIKAGELSARSEGQERLINITELIRVFGELKAHLKAEDGHVETSPTEQVLRERIDDLQERVKFLQKQIENYEQKDRTILEILGVEQRKTERLLESPRRGGGILSRIFKKSPQKEPEGV